MKLNKAKNEWEKNFTYSLPKHSVNDIKTLEMFAENIKKI